MELIGQRALDAPLAPDTPWHEPAATHRLGIVVRAGSAERRELPLEVLVAVPQELAGRPIRAFCLLPGQEPQEITAQLDNVAGECGVPSSSVGGTRRVPSLVETLPVPLSGQTLTTSSHAGGREEGAAPSPSTRRRLVALIPGPVPSEALAKVFVYLGLPEPPPALSQAVFTTDGPVGMKWIENDRVRLLLGPEGAHVYRWELKSLDGRDLTMPGERGWAGFSDMNVLRSHRRRCRRRRGRHRIVPAHQPLHHLRRGAGGGTWRNIEPPPRYPRFEQPAARGGACGGGAGGVKQSCESFQQGPMVVLLMKHFSLPFPRLRA